MMMQDVFLFEFTVDLSHRNEGPTVLMDFKSKIRAVIMVKVFSSLGLILVL